MSLTHFDIQRISHLARIQLTENEADELSVQLNAFFQLVKQMQTVDTTNILPLANPIEQMINSAPPLREDIVIEKNEVTENLALAPVADKNVFLVPLVIE